MEVIINIFNYLVPFLVVLSVLVFVHEFGHFIVARWCGVRVEEFSIGFGKELWGRTDKYGTRWKVSAIPLGGFVRMFGDADAASTEDMTKEYTEEEKKVAFPFKHPIKKLAVIFAGPLTNYLFAIVITAGIFMSYGKLTYPAVVGSVIENSAAEKAGIMVNDKIIKINNTKIESFQDIKHEISTNSSDSIIVRVLREDKEIDLNVSPQLQETENEFGEKEKRVVLGITSVPVAEVSSEKLGFVPAVKEATTDAVKISYYTLRALGQMITGAREANEIGGIIRIAEISGDIAKTQSIVDFLYFMALLSINLGLINLLPIPLLDGGHIVIYSIELFIRRKINQKFKELLFKFGFAVVLSLMLFATFNDVSRLFTRWF
jgi:regulator of sigma E protease